MAKAAGKKLREEIEDYFAGISRMRVVTDKTLYAYEYYTGQPWQSEEEDSGNLAVAGKMVFSPLVDALLNRDREAAQQHLDEVWDGLTDVQKNEVQKLLKQYGYRYQP